MGRDSNALPIAKLIEVQQPQGFGAGAQGDTGSQPFPTKQYDVTNSAQLYCNCGVCCGMSQTLTLEAEEVVFRDANCMGESVRRTVYGEISMVDKQTACGCCAAVMTNVFAVSPGCGCEHAHFPSERLSRLHTPARTRDAPEHHDSRMRVCTGCSQPRHAPTWLVAAHETCSRHLFQCSSLPPCPLDSRLLHLLRIHLDAGETALVDEIVSELKARTRNRGDAGQVQRADKQIAMIQTVDEKVTNLEAKLELLMRHLNVEQPAPGNIERY